MSNTTQTASEPVTGEVSAAGSTVTALSIPGEDRPHHPYSPSSLQSLEVCPMFKSRESKHERTIAGSIAHKSTETREDDDRLSDDDAVAVAECLDFYDSRKAIYEKEGFDAWNRQPPGEDSKPLSLFQVSEGIETYLEIDDLVFPDCTSTTAGYVDRWLLSWDNKRAEVIDWKFGKWQVEDAANNLQGMAYTLGLFRKFPSIEEVTFWFKQPLIDFITSTTFTRADVASIYLRIQTVVARARRARDEMKAGNWSLANPMVPNCNFCAHIGECEKVREFACAIGKKFHPLGIPDNITPSLVMDPANTQIGLDLASVVKVWAEAFRRVLSDRVIRGDAPIPNGMKVQTMRKRQLVNMDEYKKLALEQLTQFEWDSCLDTTFGDVEKLISKKAPRGHKEEAVKEFQARANAVGATKLGEPFSFLKVSSEKSTD